MSNMSENLQEYLLKKCAYETDAWRLSFYDEKCHNFAHKSTIATIQIFHAYISCCCIIVNDSLKLHNTLGYYEAEEEVLDAQEQADLIPIEGDKILCLKCNKTLASMKSAKQHFNLSHQTNQKAYCQICHKVFKNTHSRNVHMKQTHGVSASMMKNAITMPKH